MKRNINPTQVKPNHPIFNKKASQAKMNETCDKSIGNNKTSQVKPNELKKQMNKWIGDKQNKINFDSLIEGFENSGFVVDDNAVILRLLDICREHNMQDVKQIIQFARHSLAPNSKINHTLVDSIQDSIDETEEEFRDVENDPPAKIKTKNDTKSNSNVDSEEINIDKV